MTIADTARAVLETDPRWRPLSRRRYCAGGSGAGRVGCGRWAAVERYGGGREHPDRQEIRRRWRQGEHDYVALAFHFGVSPVSVHRWTRDLRTGQPESLPKRGRWVPLCTGHANGRFVYHGEVYRWYINERISA